MSPREIRAELMLRGIKQQEIADSLGVSASHVSHVIDGKRTSERVQRAIAKAIGRPVHQVFPGEVA